MITFADLALQYLLVQYSIMGTNKIRDALCAGAYNHIGYTHTCYNEGNDYVCQ